MGVLSVGMVYKAVRLVEITQGVSVGREKKTS